MEIGLQNNVSGIRQSSPFNVLQSYHVCMPGLPPCIAHDLFEGVVAYDIMLIIEYFVHKEWFSEQHLNSRTKQFKFDATAAHSKALPAKFTAKKLSSNASQNWCFIRFFPLFIIFKVKDFADPVWKMLLLLRQWK